MDRADTDGERVLGRLLQHFEPPPEPQVWVTPGRRTDWCFRMLRLAVEYLGSVDHGFAARRAADLVRDDERPTGRLLERVPDSRTQDRHVGRFRDERRALRVPGVR